MIVVAVVLVVIGIIGVLVRVVVVTVVVVAAVKCCFATSQGFSNFVFFHAIGHPRSVAVLCNLTGHRMFAFNFFGSLVLTCTYMLSKFLCDRASHSGQGISLVVCSLMDSNGPRHLAM